MLLHYALNLHTFYRERQIRHYRMYARCDSDRRAWTEQHQLKMLSALYKGKCNYSFWKSEIEIGNDMRKLWRTLNGVLGEEDKLNKSLKELSGEDFAAFFREKVETVSEKLRPSRRTL